MTGGSRTFFFQLDMYIYIYTEVGDVGKSGQECWTCRLWLMYAYVSADVSYYNLLDL